MMFRQKKCLILQISKISRLHFVIGKEMLLISRNMLKIEKRHLENGLNRGFEGSILQIKLSFHIVEKMMYIKALI